MKFSFSIVGFLLCIGVCNGEWTEPYFEITEDVKNDVKFNCNKLKCQIEVNEDLKENQALLNVLNDDTNLTFTVHLPLENPWELKYENHQIILGKKLDFEALKDKKSVASLNELQLEINIQNINNKPISFTYVTSQCAIEENKILTTDCYYTVKDPDGWLSEPKYTLSTEDDVFDFEITDVSENEKKYTLRTKKELDYETVSVYSITFTISDGIHEDDTYFIVKVIDMPDEDPIWLHIFASQQVTENEPFEYTVLAKDGDLGIQAKIKYAIACDDEIDVEIGPYNGIITSKKGIDRDTPDKSIFPCTITAYEEENELSKVDQPVSFIVIDVNNKWPEITFKENEEDVKILNLEMLESSKAKIPDNILINVNDKDTGKNAYYKVELQDVDDKKKFTKAFQISPISSYKDFNFALKIMNNTLLDFEDTEWRTFEMNVVSIETEDSSHTRKASIKVNLINWNDEKPIFEEKGQYDISVEETIGSNTEIAKVKATDRDGDELDYELSGSYIKRLLIIEKDEQGYGVLKTNVERAFDFETMETVIFEVIAREANTKDHYTATVEFTINVIDVNDETPQIIISNTLNAIDENQPDGTILEHVEITVKDGDKNAQLKTEIDWDKSYFTKSGALVQDEKIDIYKGCITLNLIDENNPKLQIKEKVANNTPDFELFDTIYINIKVVDLNQIFGVNSAEATFSISIKDVNDNPPIFIESTITSSKTVNEKSKIDTVVGIVTARDRDGEGNNDITYSLKPRNGTLDNLIDIDKTGELRVVSENIIADPPDGFTYLYYDVSASDEVHLTTEEIKVYVVDQNNQKPEIEFVPEFIKIEEKSKEGSDVTQISATDNDRDEPFNVLRYALDESSKKIFRINPGNGKITVGPDGPQLLDRDFGDKSFTITGIISDNEGDSSNGIVMSVPFSFPLTLTDINDQRPEIKGQTEDIVISQNTKKDAVISTVEAVDKDEEGNPNSRIGLSIINILSENERDIPKDLFVIDNSSKQSPATFDLKTGIDLECCYGIYNLIIKASDHGVPSLDNTKDASYTVNIEPYNFKEPIITYPEDGHQFLLSTDQDKNFKLNCYIHDEDCIKDFSATDDQGDKFEVNFAIDSNTNPGDIFYFRKERSKATLLLNQINFKPFEKYNLNIIATTQGEPETSTTISITVTFVDPNPYPFFNETDRNQIIDINECNITFIATLPNAMYPFDYDIPGFEKNIYYFIEDVDPKTYKNNFKIEEKINKFQLIKELDRETDEIVTFNIIASRTSTGTVVEDGSIMSVKINIIDDNDNPPVFTEDNYSATIMVSYDVGKFLTIVKATDKDVNSSLEWSEVETIPYGDGIDNTNNIFVMDPKNGSILLNFKVQNSMNGYFDYKVKVTDGLHDIFTTVKIYIVTEDNRLEMKFKNPLKIVEDSRDQIRSILTKNTGYECRIESIQKGIDENGNQVDSYTSVLTYFLDPKSLKPMPKNTMQAKLTVLTTYKNLVNEFKEINLNLMSLGEEKEVTDNIEEVLRAWLIGVSVGLGTICLILLIFFIIKVRSLTNRINKLTVTKFGSQESGLNRIAAPGTNMRTAEGANPIFNINNMETKEIDRQSIQSYESGLIGVENNDDFNLDNFNPRRESVNPTLFPSEVTY